MYREFEPPAEINVRRVVTLLGVAFVVALAIVVGTRLSSDAIAVLVGVIAGVAASIPTALLLIAVTRRREEEQYTERYEDPRRSAPPVVVVAPGGVPQVLPQYPGSYPAQLSPGRGVPDGRIRRRRARERRWRPGDRSPRAR